MRFFRLLSGILLWGLLSAYSSGENQAFILLSPAEVVVTGNAAAATTLVVKGAVPSVSENPGTELVTFNLTTGAELLCLDGVIFLSEASTPNGGKYSGEKIRQAELRIGLNDVTVGWPGASPLYQLKILRLPLFNDLAKVDERGSILALAALGALPGDLPHAYNPRRLVRRQELAAAILHLQGFAAPALRGVLDEIDLLANQGVIVGYPDGLLRANADLTKGELALTLARLLDLPLRAARTQSIVNREHWADPAIGALVRSGLYVQSDFVPRDGGVTKAHLAELLARLPQVSERIRALADYQDVSLPLPSGGGHVQPDTARDLRLFGEIIYSQ
ncbi:hypothetical protein NO2_0338 [Candidatus Termititenax persephonae]|uniref:SLH domain-containing protein n=1 Tax=Candidatus Termititenax persephonae TaxID=2218525 RepID=A0A388TF67_9BACT|nr:hypothetical protein NO2_0338 [Candidatus Termititenax persephonae]